MNVFFYTNHKGKEKKRAENGMCIDLYCTPGALCLEAKSRKNELKRWRENFATSVFFPLLWILSFLSYFGTGLILLNTLWFKPALRLLSTLPKHLWGNMAIEESFVRPRVLILSHSNFKPKPKVLNHNLTKSKDTPPFGTDCSSRLISHRIVSRAITFHRDDKSIPW